ncbi:hypothetical protein ASD23_02335 [Agromyces sp. Root1464]|uniref:hypothetical protein n=1 Tax=Agromyces sp. Root1464 TaxID=1736467 RepID=UPI0006F8D7D4|nr:hypothetical protein [Agromyces sp. Root1464]KQZ10988.1 hypothetical protein ASD23_02335 [Agromyces sp. Root1464]
MLTGDGRLADRRPVDFHVLDAPLGRQDLAAYAAHRDGAWGPWRVSLLGSAASIGLGIATVWLFPRFGWLVVLVGGLALALVVSGWRWWLVGFSRSARLARFANANGFAYADELRNDSRAGVGFPPGKQNVGRASIFVDGAHGTFLIGQNTMVTPRGESAVDFRRPFRFVELALPAAVPHVLLKNRRSRILPMIDGAAPNSVRLGLEGDFDRSFTLYCPKGYERDALYLFTPNVMAALLDVARTAEVELVDRRMYVYLPARTPVWTPDGMRSVFDLVELLGRRVHRNAVRYADDRAEESGTVAQAGSRIRTAGRFTGLTVIWLLTIVVSTGLILIGPALLARS